MQYAKTKETMLEEITSGITDMHKMKIYKKIEMASNYLYERDVDDMDPIINLDRPNINMLRGFLDVVNEVKLNQLKEELADAVIIENKEELDELFEQQIANHYNDDFIEVHDEY